MKAEKNRFLVRCFLGHLRKERPEPTVAFQMLACYGGSATLGDLACIHSRRDRLDVAEFICYFLSNHPECVIDACRILQALAFSGADEMAAKAIERMLKEHGRNQKIRKKWPWPIEDIQARAKHLSRYYPWLTESPNPPRKQADLKLVESIEDTRERETVLSRFFPWLPKSSRRNTSLKLVKIKE